MVQCLDMPFQVSVYMPIRVSELSRYKFKLAIESAMYEVLEYTFYRTRVLVPHLVLS